jgi:hypothetical protein
MGGESAPLRSRENTVTVKVAASAMTIKVVAFALYRHRLNELVHREL